MGETVPQSQLGLCYHLFLRLQKGSAVVLVFQCAGSAWHIMTSTSEDLSTGASASNSNQIMAPCLSVTHDAWQPVKGYVR